MLVLLLNIKRTRFVNGFLSTLSHSTRTIFWYICMTSSPIMMLSQYIINTLSKMLVKDLKLTESCRGKTNVELTLVQKLQRQMDLGGEPGTAKCWAAHLWTRNLTFAEVRKTFNIKPCHIFQSQTLLNANKDALSSWMEKLSEAKLRGVLALALGALWFTTTYRAKWRMRQGPHEGSELQVKKTVEQNSTIWIGKTYLYFWKLFPPMLSLIYYSPGFA